MPAAPFRLEPGEERQLAATIFNHVWDLLNEPEQEERVVMLAPSHWHAVPARKILVAPLVFQRNGLLDRTAQIGEFPGAGRIGILADLKTRGRGIRRLRCSDINALLLPA